MPTRLPPMSPADRRFVLDACITRHGVTPDATFPEGDHRVSLCVIHNAAEIVFVAAIPPSSVALLEHVCDVRYPRAGLIASDYHFGTPNGLPTNETDVEEAVLRLVRRGGVLHAGLVDDLFHARSLALKAAAQGHRWTGTEEDLPRCLRTDAMEAA